MTTMAKKIVLRLSYPIPVLSEEGLDALAGTVGEASSEGVSGFIESVGGELMHSLGHDEQCK